MSYPHTGIKETEGKGGTSSRVDSQLAYSKHPTEGKRKIGITGIEWPVSTVKGTNRKK